MFLDASTPNARIAGQHYPHILSTLPAMHNPSEQSAITNKVFLLHSFHAAMSLYQKAYGWSVCTLFEQALLLTTGEEHHRAKTMDLGVVEDMPAPLQFHKAENLAFKVQPIQGFIPFALGAATNLPATQGYTPDGWVSRNIENPKGPWLFCPGEDWGSVYCLRVWWNALTSFGNNVSKVDCETSAAAAASNNLSLREMLGESIPVTLRCVAKQLGFCRKPALQSTYGDNVPGMDVQSYGSLVDFLKNRIQHYQNTEMTHMDDQAYIDCMTCMVYLVSSPAINHDIVIGTAFSAKQDSTKIASEVKDTRAMGGHAYGIMTYQYPTMKLQSDQVPPRANNVDTTTNSVNKIAVIMEGTAAVVNRLMVEDADQVDSIMLFAKGVCVLGQNMKEPVINGTTINTWDNPVTSISAWDNVEFRPLMNSTSKSSPQKFYNKAFVASRLTTYQDAVGSASGVPTTFFHAGIPEERSTSSAAPMGAFLFQRDPVAKQLSFGVFPEFAGIRDFPRVCIIWDFPQMILSFGICDTSLALGNKI